MGRPEAWGCGQLVLDGERIVVDHSLNARRRATALAVRGYNELLIAHAERAAVMRIPDQWPLPTREEVVGL